jgi:thiaminase
MIEVIDKINIKYADKIMKTNFVSLLLDGSLHIDVFSSFISQDIQYLKQDFFLFKKLAEKSTSIDIKEFLLKVSNDCISFEQYFQNIIVKEFEIQTSNFLNDAFNQYIKHLQCCVKHMRFDEAYFALLPCYLLYFDLGKRFECFNTEKNQFKTFISTYSGTEFESFVNRFMNLAKEILVKKSVSEIVEISKIYETSCKYELGIFQSF